MPPVLCFWGEWPLTFLAVPGVLLAPVFLAVPGVLLAPVFLAGVFLAGAAGSEVSDLQTRLSGVPNRAQPLNKLPQCLRLKCNRGALNVVLLARTQLQT